MKVKNYTIKDELKYNELKNKLVNVNNELYINFLIYGNIKNNELYISTNLNYIESLFKQIHLIRLDLFNLISFV